MSDSSSSVSLLVDAKKEYVTRLAEVVAPSVLQCMDELYTSAQNTGGTSKTLLHFQMLLREVPKWNSDAIQVRTNSIIVRAPFFGDLIAAVFVSYVKVLSSIKLNTKRPNIRLKLPSNESFVHQTYVSTAKHFYENPLLARSDDHSERFAIVVAAIESTVREMLPLADILKAYLGNSVDNSDQTMNPNLSPIQSDDDDEEEQEEEQEEDTSFDPVGVVDVPQPPEEKLIQFNPAAAAPMMPAPAPPLAAAAAAAPPVGPSPVPVPVGPIAPAEPLFTDADDDERGFA